MTCSALALVLAAAPVAFDLKHGGFHVGSAHATLCFVAGTRVRMTDGSSRPIESIVRGDLVLGANGRANRVTAVERVPLAGRQLFGFDGGSAFVTAEHPFMTTSGWRALEKALVRGHPIMAQHEHRQRGHGHRRAHLTWRTVSGVYCRVYRETLTIGARTEL